MAATGVAATFGAAVAGVPAPADGLAGSGSTCGSCHGSDWSRGNLRCCSRRHAGSHRWHDWQWQHLWELPWQRLESRRPAMLQSPACPLPPMAWLAVAALASCGSRHGSDWSRGNLRCCSRRPAGSRRWLGWQRQQLWQLPWQRSESRRPAVLQSPACRLPQMAWLAAAAIVGAAMAAIGVASTCGVAVAGMPAPTDGMTGSGSSCGSCHGSDWSRGNLRCCSRRHAGCHSASDRKAPAGPAARVVVPRARRATRCRR